MKFPLENDSHGFKQFQEIRFGMSNMTGHRRFWHMYTYTYIRLKYSLTQMMRFGDVFILNSLHGF